MIHEFFASSEPAIDQQFILNDRQLELIDKVMNNLEVCQSLHSLESIEIMAEHLKTARGCLNDFKCLADFTCALCGSAVVWWEGLANVPWQLCQKVS